MVGRWSVRALVARLALAGVAALLLAVVAPGAAMALEVHHILPEPGSTVATAPDHLEVMFDEDLQSGRVQIGLSPDTTNVPVALTAPLVEGNLAIQPLPALPAGAYSAGFRVLGHDGHLYQGTFGFTVGGGGPTVPTAAAPARSWLVTGVAAGLALPAVVAVIARARRRV